MSLRIRRGNDTARTGITPAEGELIWTVDTKQLFVGDGTTAGGIGTATDASVVKVTGNQSIAGNKTFTNSTASTTTTTGAVVVTGGVGVGGNVNVGGNVGVTGGFDAGGVISTGSTAASTSTVTGSIVTKGGIGADGAINVGGKITTTDTTPSLSASDGALVVAGGAGIGGDLNVGDECSIGTDLLVNGSAEVVAGFQSNSTATLMAELAHTGSTAGFFGATPASQPAAIADSTGTGDVVAQLNLLLAAMRTLGLIAT